MKKVMKYIIVSSVFIIGSFGVNGDKANASIRHRIMQAFRNMNCFSCLRTPPLNKEIKVKVKSKFIRQANNLSDNGITLGVPLKDFNEKAIRHYRDNRWYLQRRNSNGDTTTIIASSKPTVTDIKDGNVQVKYKNTAGEDVTVYHRGLPNWVSGKDIKQRLRQTGFLSTDTRRSSSSYSSGSESGETTNNTGNQHRVVFQANSIFGSNISDFDKSQIKKIDPRKWYYQYRLGNGKVVTVESDKDPNIAYSTSGIVTTNPQGNVKVPKYINWIKGADLLN